MKASEMATSVSIVNKIILYLQEMENMRVTFNDLSDALWWSSSCLHFINYFGPFKIRILQWDS